MSHIQTNANQRRLTLALYGGGSIIVILAIGFFIANAPRLAQLAAATHGPHAPRLAVFAGVPAAMIVHILASLAAIGLGAVMLWSRKGAKFHRIAGWTWAGLMTVAAVTPLLVLNRPHFGPNFIHATIPLVLILLPRALLAARRHDAPLHARTMRWTYGIVVGAGVFTLIPGRLIWQAVFG